MKDESTSRMLEDTARILIEEYQGDLRKFRAQADLNPEQERKLLKGAERLHFGKNALDLQKTMKQIDFIRFIAGLARIELENDYDSFEKG